MALFAPLLTAIVALALSIPLPMCIDMTCCGEETRVLGGVLVGGRMRSLFRWRGPGPGRRMLLQWLTGRSTGSGRGRALSRFVAVLRSARGLRVSVSVRVGRRERGAWLILAGGGVIAELARRAVRSRLPEVRSLHVEVGSADCAMTITASCIGHFRIGKVILSYAKG